ncbi:hypothetical protein A6X20_41585 [Bradyrhizobium elkanii]|nr:hypothetical protein A6X20_41585 [Bradyrhizobium elkanii]ODM72177.1 hypothetical protein A6452_41480 [Bradyrhizobium elkanii]
MLQLGGPWALAGEKEAEALWTRESSTAGLREISNQCVPSVHGPLAGGVTILENCREVMMRAHRTVRGPSAEDQKIDAAEPAAGAAIAAREGGFIEQQRNTL